MVEEGICEDDRNYLIEGEDGFLFMELVWLVDVEIEGIFLGRDR